MKKLSIFAISLMLGVLAANCGSSGGGNNNNNSTCTDPTGTVTTALGTATTASGGAALSEAFSFHTGATQHTTNCTGYYKECEIWFKLNFWSGAAWNEGETTNTWIADIGAVTCLGDVTTIPTAGFTTSAEAIEGHAYVMKLYDGQYARFYMNRFVTNTSGGIIGAEIKWQYPFEPSALYAVTVTVGSNVAVNSDVWGINGCTTASLYSDWCTHYFEPSTVVKLTATGGGFSSWSGDCSSNPCTLTMDADKNATAD
jgi:hypothetical protein